MVAVAVLLVAAACSGRGSSRPSAADVRAYLNTVEPIRLGVNQLLNGADPILSAYHDHAITPVEAASRMADLEARFAAATVAIAEVHPANAALEALHLPYAHTFVLEDSYLSALVASLPDGDFGDLPTTQNDQRAAIIAWRTGLQQFADTDHMTLPADLAQAGRGEIAPSPGGS